MVGCLVGSSSRCLEKRLLPGQPQSHPVMTLFLSQLTRVPLLALFVRTSRRQVAYGTLSLPVVGVFEAAGVVVCAMGVQGS